MATIGSTPEAAPGMISVCPISMWLALVNPLAARMSGTVVEKRALRRVRLSPGRSRYRLDSPATGSSAGASATGASATGGGGAGDWTTSGADGATGTATIGSGTATAPPGMISV